MQDRAPAALADHRSQRSFDDPWWNPAVESQAVDRAYRLTASDTVEDKVVELQAHERELAAALFGGERGTLRDMTRDDLELLLS